MNLLFISHQFKLKLFVLLQGSFLSLSQLFPDLLLLLLLLLHRFLPYSLLLDQLLFVNQCTVLHGYLLAFLVHS